MVRSMCPSGRFHIDEEFRKGVKANATPVITDITGDLFRPKNFQSVGEKAKHVGECCALL